MFKASKVLGITTGLAMAVAAATPAFALEQIRPVGPSLEQIRPVRPSLEQIRPVRPN